MKEAMEKLEKEEKEAKKMLELGDRDRPYNSQYDVKAPTEHEMEAFRMRQIHPDDPMAKYFANKE